MKALLGKKIGMTQMFNAQGRVVPVTLLEAGPCKVLQIRTKENDGYQATQLGFEELPKRKQGKKSRRGKEFRHIKEFRNGADCKVGDAFDVSMFQEGETVKISGISKGKGFQGGVKRWNLRARRGTHGVKHEHRTIGSIGSSFPERVVKGKRMPGHMGAARITVKNLKIAKVDTEHNLLVIQGAIPGPKGALMEIRG